MLLLFVSSPSQLMYCSQSYPNDFELTDSAYEQQMKN